MMEKNKQHTPQMDQFEWPDESPVRSVSVVKQQKYPTAYIEASSDADPSLFEALPHYLESRGIRNFADEFEGKQVLRVWGFEDTHQLMGMLVNAKVTHGSPTQTKRAAKESFSPVNWVKEHSVQAAGMTYLVGDGLLLASGAMRKDGSQISGALKWGATSMLLTGFGTKDPVAQMDRLYSEVGDYLEKSDFELSDEDHKTLTKLRQGGDGAWADMKHILSEHVLTLNNIIFGLGGINMAKAGIAQDNNMFKTASGAAVTTGMWGALLIPEDEEAGMSRGEIKAKKEAESRGEKFEGKPVDAFQQPWNWLKRKPLRLAGMGAGLNNVLMGISGWVYEFPKRREQLKMAIEGTEEFTKAQAAMRGAVCDGLSPGAYVVANTFYGMSPKDRRGFLKEEGYTDELFTVAAHIFSELPKEERSIRLAQFSGFLSSHPEMKASAEEVQDVVEDKIEAILQSPWHQASVKNHTPRAVADANTAQHQEPLAQRDAAAAIV